MECKCIYPIKWLCDYWTEETFYRCPVCDRIALVYVDKSIIWYEHTQCEVINDNKR
jgi:hypothetical protein